VLLTCPACSAAYEVPARLLKAGRIVRCARCGAEWVPLIEPASTAEATAPPDAGPESDPEPPSLFPVADAPPPATATVSPVRDRLLVLAWVASIATVIAVLAAGYVWRADVMDLWPASARLYAMLGLSGVIIPSRQ